MKTEYELSTRFAAMDKKARPLKRLFFKGFAVDVDSIQCKTFSGDLTRQQIEFSRDFDYRFNFGRDSCHDV